MPSNVLNHWTKENQVLVRREAFTKHLLTFWADENRPDFFNRLQTLAEAEQAQVVSQMVLGGEGQPPASVKWPLTWLRGDASTQTDPGGCQAVAIAGVPVQSLDLDGHPVGCLYEDDNAVYLHLAGILPSDSQAEPTLQARQFFERMETVLAMADMEFHHVVRTWLYLARLLDWYDDFNSVRSQFFQERGIFERMVPASTGISATNPSGSAIIGDAVAVKPKTERVRVAAVTSPLQCPALDYRSSFSRAAEVVSPDGHELYISGTASIDPDGETVHVGDTKAQIDLSMRVVEAILQSRSMDWSNVTQGIAYIKNIADLPLFESYLAKNKLNSLPVACLHADICRDDLLFEIEVDAFASA